MRKKLFTFLFALVTSVGMSWADHVGLQVTEFDVPGEWENDETLVTASDLPGFVAVSYAEAGTWNAAPTDEDVVDLIFAFGAPLEGINITYFTKGVWKDGVLGGPYTRAQLFLLESYGYKLFYTVGAPTPTNPVIKLNADFGGDWADTDAFMDNGNGKASWSISTLTAGYWYHFGVKVDGTWTSDNADFDREDPSRVVSGTGDAMWFQADAEGEYTFTWEYATNTLTIGFPNPVKPNSISINGTAPKVGDTSVSLDYYFNPANVPGFYAYYAPTLKLKCVEDDNYSETSLGNNSISLGVRNLSPQGGSFQAGKTYQICFAYNNGGWVDDVFQTLTFSSNTVGMKGSWDEWADVVNFTDNGDGTASVTKTFEHEGYYTFKTVLNGGDWRGNGEAFKRDYTGAEGITGNTDMTLWVDAKGEYTFTWTYASNRIDITYPALPTIYMNGEWDWEEKSPFTDNDDGTASFSMHFSIPDCYKEFKIRVGEGDWRGNGETFNADHTSSAWINENGSNMNFYVGEPGDYTFTWTYVENKLTILRPNSITINGTPAVGDNSISLTYYFNPANVPGIGGYAPTLKVKRVEDGKYDEEWLSLYYISYGTQTINFSNIISLQPGKTYQACFAYYANGAWHDEVFQTFSISNNTVGMKGSWDSWVNVVYFTDNGDGTASVTKSFEHEGYYTFKTVLGGDDWRGNGEAFKRNYTGAEGIVGNTDMTLWVDAKGEYTFTWTYASNRIDITYPALPTVYLYLNGSADAFTNHGDGTASYYYHLSNKGSYKDFKIRVGNSDLRSNGQTFNPEHTTYDWINDNGGGAYMKIYIDAEADYTFTWTYVENKLEITHPVVPDYTVMTKVDPENPGVYYSTFYSSNYSYKLMDDGTVAFIAKISNGDLVLTQIAEGEQVIPAGTAVIFRKTGSSLPIGLRDTQENNTNFDPADNDLEGVDHDTEVTDIPGLTVDNCYVLSGMSHDESVKGVGFYKIYGTELKQHKAYVKYAGGQNNAPKKMRFVYCQATGIEDVQGNNVQSTKVIENGVLYIIRDGKTYNAMGQVVK